MRRRLLRRPFPFLDAIYVFTATGAQVRLAHPRILAQG
jgi:hypothetical protein